MALVRDPDHIRLAMLGMVPGNGHPFSWSAIINGRYDQAEMERCGYPVIPRYLGAQPPGALGLPGARVTHVWCDRPEDGPRVARAACISHVAVKPEDVIGQVDAVLIATDIGGEHVARARPFIEAGLPVFIDKPLADNEPDLLQFMAWHRAGRPFLSSSAMRYAPEYAELRRRLPEVGELRLAVNTTPKSWERYGIHALEGIYPLLRPGGWRSVRHSGDARRALVHIRHAAGTEALVAAIDDLAGAFGCASVYGTAGSLAARSQDTFAAFKGQLASFVSYLRTGRSPVPLSETFELMRIIIAGLRSRAEGGREVGLAEIAAGGDR